MPHPRDVAAFVAIAETSHFGRAAEQIGVAQPTVSRMLRRLETDIGLTLVERTSHHVSLTAGGQLLLEPARRLLRQHEQFAAACEQIAGGTAGVLRLGTTVDMGEHLGRALARFAANRPEIRVELFPARTPEKIELVRTGGLDAAYVREAVAPPGLRLEPLWSDAVVAVRPAGPASRVPLLLTERRDNPAVHDRLAALAGGSPVRPFRGRQEALAAVRAGAAWTILHADTVPVDPALMVSPFHPPVALGVGLLWRPAAAAAPVRDFVAAAADA